MFGRLSRDDKTDNLFFQAGDLPLTKTDVFIDYASLPTLELTVL